MEKTLQLLSGNEALALGAYHAGVQVATAYPGTPSTEILENLSRFKDIYAEWSTNEKVAMEVAMGAAYTGARAMVSMKHVGLNVASDPFMAASMTGIIGGLVVVSADDPQIHSSQNEQDNRHYARLAKVPMLEPSDSQEAYDLMALCLRYQREVRYAGAFAHHHPHRPLEVGGGREAQPHGEKPAAGFPFQRAEIRHAAGQRSAPPRRSWKSAWSSWRNMPRPSR